MTWWRSPAWATVGRAAFLAFLVVTIHHNSARLDDPGGQWAVTVAAALCAAVLTVPQLRLSAAPLLVSAATACWGWLLDLLLAVVLFDLAVARRTRTAVLCAALALAGNLAGVRAASVWVGQRWVSTLTVLLFGLVVGLWQGNRRRLVHTLAGQVEQLRVEARLREDAARAAERTRIAAEMHDVLAHRLSLIALHAGVLATRGGGLPGPVADRLALLRTASVEALTDLREVLGALHDPGAAPAGAPAVRDLRALVEDAREAGQQVELTVTGRAPDAPTTHRLAAYRIVQEALTNARKHAAGAPVEVRVDYRPPTTLVHVANPAGAAGPAAVDSGYGLVGLRERVTALGGHLDAGPAGTGSWRLSARLPHPAPKDGPA
ncbi:sensor histidine kinase [Kitasatospora cheerisanensis]|uniref:sensor histidine kinase n=1 Tax=Kitasatospora cheerisanensis TaxID=81942 RepID=UPI001FCB385C|nr:histidine kinase [Kitasatospora cheerisanensis]